MRWFAPSRREDHPDAERGALLDDAQVARAAVQALDAVVRDRDDVLDPDPEPAVEVDARLDGERHPRLQDGPIALYEVGRLVDLKADPVTGPVDEAVAVPGALDHRSGDPVELLGLDAGADRLDGRRLRFLDDVVGGFEAVGWLDDDHGPGRVAEVAAELAAEVQHDGVPGQDRA